MPKLSKTSRDPDLNPRTRVLYATTREATYARNQTLIDALTHYADVEVVAPAGDGRGFDRRILYALGLIRVLVRVLAHAVHPRRGRDTLVVGFLAQPLAVALRPIWRGRLIADAMVSVYDTICLDKRFVLPDSTLGRIARWLDRYLIRHADGLIFDTQQHQEFFRTFVSHTFPESCVVPVGARVLRRTPRKERLTERLQVVFAGSYIPLQGAHVIVEAAKLLRNEPVDFTMIGAGQDFRDVAATVRQQELRSVRLVGWVSLEVLDDLYCQADVILGIFGSTNKTQRVIPNKVFEALSIGQPVITSDTPALRELFVPGQDVICCAAAEPESLAESIRWVNAHREHARAIGLAGKIAFERQASAAALAAALRPLFPVAKS